MPSEEHREHHLRTPTRELPHADKVRRQQRHLQILTVVLVAVLAMLAYAAAFDLDHWAEWIVFGAICFTALGAIVAVHSR
jgi:membrane protein YdbS with pleckstrin-like domain